MAPRSTEQRVADSLALLRAGGDAWVATAADSTPHLILLSLVWDEEAGEAVFCTDEDTPTVRSAGEARVGLGATRDVLLLRGRLRVAGRVDADAQTAELFAATADWDPRKHEGDWVFLRLRPVLAMAWREADEIAGRTIMRDGRWLA